MIDFDQLTIGARFIKKSTVQIYRVTQRHGHNMVIVVWENPDIDPPGWFPDWGICYWRHEPELLADMRLL